MSPEQSAYIDRLIREQQRRTASFIAHRVVALLETMRAYRIPLPACWRGVRR